MSVATIIRVSLAEKKAKEIIEDAKRKAKSIIDDAKSQARIILSEEHIEKLTEQFIERFKKELSSLKFKSAEGLDEEFERLNSVSREELESLVNEILEVMFK